MRVLKGSRSVGRARWVYGGPVGLKGVRWGRRGRVGWGCKISFLKVKSLLFGRILTWVLDGKHPSTSYACLGYKHLQRTLLKFNLSQPFSFPYELYKKLERDCIQSNISFSILC